MRQRSRANAGSRAGSTGGDGADAARRERALDATEGILRERSLGAVTLGAVSSAAGVPRSALRVDFAGRDGLLADVFDHVGVRVCGAMREAFESAPSFTEGVRGALSELLCFLEREPSLARFLVVDSLTASSLLHARRARVMGRIATVLDERRPPGVDMATPPCFRAEMVVAAVASILHSRLLDSDAALDELRRSLTAVVVLPYLGVEATRSELTRPARP